MEGKKKINNKLTKNIITRKVYTPRNQSDRFERKYGDGEMKDRIVKVWTSIMIILFLLIAVSSLTTSSKSRMFQGGLKHDGNIQYEINETDDSSDWNFKTETSISSQPVIKEGVIYITTGTLNEKGTLYALNDDGTEKWSFTPTPEGSLDNTPAVDENGTIYVGSYNHNFYSINPNGSLKWSFDTGGPVYSSAVIDGEGTIYVGSGVANEWGTLYAFNQDGTLKWEFPTSDKIPTSPAIDDDGTIYISCHDGNIYALTKDGSKIWSYDLGFYTGSSPTIGPESTIYVGCRNEKVYAITPDGTEKWHISTKGYVDSSVAVGQDGTIYFGSVVKGKVKEGRTLYAVTPDGEVKWKFGDSGVTTSSPVISENGIILIGSTDYSLYAVNPDGTERWSYTSDGPIWESPNIGPDGTIYFGNLNGKLYAIHGGNDVEVDDEGSDPLPSFSFLTLTTIFVSTAVFYRRWKDEY